MLYTIIGIPTVKGLVFKKVPLSFVGQYYGGYYGSVPWGKAPMA